MRRAPVKSLFSRQNAPSEPRPFNFTALPAICRVRIRLGAAAKALGVVLAEPFLQVAFLTLPVIPHLKITGKGLVDVDRFDFV